MARQSTGNPGVKARAGRNIARPAPKAGGVTPAATPPKGPESSAPILNLREKPKISPAKFAEEVRGEARKITWPSWKETWITSVMVFIMVAVTAVFFLVVDGSLSFLANQFLKLAG